jgi:DNA-damage-inducible protein J
MSTIMARDATYQLRIEQSTKRDSFKVFKQLGMTPAEGIRIFLHSVAMTGSFPFQIKLPNADTLKTFADTDAGRGLNKPKNKADFFQQLKA